MLLFDDLNIMAKVAQTIIDHPKFDVSTRGRIKNRYEMSTVTSGGYRDLMICPLYDELMVVEIQLCYRPFSNIKLLSHSFYAIHRELVEWCTEHIYGKRGLIKYQDAVAHFEGAAFVTPGLKLKFF